MVPQSKLASKLGMKVTDCIDAFPGQVLAGQDCTCGRCTPAEALLPPALVELEWGQVAGLPCGAQA
jgi:hypothetical protein